MRSGRGLRDEFRTFYATAYPKLAAQVLAITGDAHIAKTATETTLAKAWHSWPSLRQTADPLVRARWMAVRAAAEHQAKGAGQAEPVQMIVGEVGEAAVVVNALQLLPPVQRRALVLHYMGGVTVNDMAALSGSSAEHIELLLDNGFTTLAETLDWADETPPDEALTDGSAGIPELDPAELDRRYDWTAEALADTAARIPDEITAPSPAAMLRRAALVRWSARAVPVAAGAACLVVAVIIAAQPGRASDPGRPTIYTQNDQAGGAPAQPTQPDLVPSAGTTSARRISPVVGLRSVALTSLLDPPSDGGAPAGTSGSSGSSRGTPRIVSVASSSVASSSGLSSSSSTAAAGGAAAAGSGGTGTTTPGPTSPGSTTTGPPITTVPVPVPTPPVDTTTTTTPPVPTDDPVTSDPITTDPVTTDPTTTREVPTDPTTTQETPSTEDTTTADSSTEGHSSTEDSGTTDNGNADHSSADSSPTDSGDS